ncbi:hypothetical protein RN001_008999 [Aquatica leii]|uniref:Uncharacterized protein n=1 Tax=Aquatica leii TaxID=1421715 RepID=A0AAN7SMN7_9COLE|nr:hypothetical protein RN001_008999 [Aquatica leii]
MQIYLIKQRVNDYYKCLTLCSILVLFYTDKSLVTILNTYIFCIIPAFQIHRHTFIIKYDVRITLETHLQ